MKNLYSDEGVTFLTELECELMNHHPVKPDENSVSLRTKISNSNVNVYLKRVNGEESIMGVRVGRKTVLDIGITKKNSVDKGKYLGRILPNLVSLAK